jgi:hypothetical protein
MDRCIPLYALLLCILLSPASAAVLNITVQDDADGTLLADASVYSNGELIGKTGTTGRLSYTHYNNESYLVKVTKSGFEDWNTMVSATETTLLAELSRKSETVTVSLYDATTLQPVQNAIVFLRGENFTASDQSDTNGKVTFRVETAQTYAIEVRASRYDTLQKTFDMDATAKEVQYWLFRSDQFVIRVLDASTMTPISNATVTVDLIPSGFTDAEGRLTLHLERERKYVIGVEKNDYQLYSKDVVISPEDALHTTLLTKSTYPVIISVFDEHLTPVQGADVLLNDTSLGKTDQYGRFGLSNLEAGPHLLEVRRSGYLTWKQVKEITKSGEDIVVELTYDSSTISIIVEDKEHKKLPGATVSVDGIEIGSTDSSGILACKLKTGSHYNISAALDGYGQVFGQTDVPLGSTNLTYTLRLERSADFTIILAAFAGIAALAIAFVGIRRFYGGRRDHRHRKR